MDPITAIGLVASIITLIDATTTTLKYLNDVKGAPKDRARLAREITGLLALMTDLRYRVEETTPSEPWFTSVSALGVDGGPLSQFSDAIDTLTTKLKPESGLKGFGKALVWTLQKNDVSEILSRIERLKTLIAWALQNDQFKLSLAIKDDIDNVKESMEENSKVVTELYEDQKNQQKRELIAWISNLNFSSKQIDYLGRHQEGTGEWLLADGTFRKWVDGDQRVLWCPGLPGAGKTILASKIIDYLDGRFTRNDVAVIYIYCSYKERTDQTAIELIANLFQQLVRRNFSISNEALSLYSHHTSKGTRPTFKEWCDVLQSEVCRFSDVFVVIDALDECPEAEGTRDTLIGGVLALPPNTRLLVTSRHITSIGNMFENVVQVEIRASDADVGLYLEDRIMKEPRLARHVKARPDLKAVIMNAIRQKARGMFLLAHLHMNSLAKKQTPRDIRNALDNLPTDIDNTYKDAMQRILGQDEEDAQLAERVLYWISFAYRPLTVFELQHALSVHLGDTGLDEEALPDESMLVSICAGLITVDQESNIIRLVHYTTQEYFERIRINRFPGAHSEIATGCLIYLSFDTFAESYCHNEEEIKNRLQKYPFLQYAAQYWGDHAREGMNETIESLVLKFLGHSIKLVSSQRLMQFSKTRYSLYSYSIPNITRLHIAASFGLVEIAKLLLDNGADATAKEHSGMTVLHWAARNGHNALVQLLLERKVNISDKDSNGCTALHLAAENGHKGVVQLLLQEEADMLAEGWDKQTALHFAANNGHEAIVQLLLDKGMDINLTSLPVFSEGGWTALHGAVRCGHETTVRLLLERGASTAIKDGNGDTALHLAAYNNYAMIVQLLLENNADIVARDNYGRTAMHLAAVHSREATARLLLERGASTAIKDTEGSTALHLAADKNHAMIVQLLLENNADIAARNNNGQTAMHLAAKHGHETTVRILGKNDIDLLAIDRDRKSALQLAAANQYETVVKLLLDYMGQQSNSEKWLATARIQGAIDCGDETKVRQLLSNGADPNVELSTCEGISLLHLAAVRDNDAVLRLLLENSADVSGVDYCKRTALHWAAARGNESATLLLLDHGAKISAEDDTELTPLHFAVSYGYKAVVKLLLERGASLITRKHQDTILRHALRGNPIGGYFSALEVKKIIWKKNSADKDHEAVLRLIIENGVDITSKDKFGRTSLHYAILYNSREKVIRLILENRVDIGAKDDIGWTALYYAVHSNNTAILRLLLENGADIETKHTITHGEEKLARDIKNDNSIEDGSTILHTAARLGREVVLRLLLEYGANINAKDNFGELALHKAARWGRIAIVKVLLANGADINAREGHLGGTALHWAASRGQMALVQYLHKKGADTIARDYEGKTPLDWASESKHEAMTLLLKSFLSSS